MAFKMEMPKISLTMTEGTIVAWHKKEGDTVAKGEVIVEISSDKMVSNEEAPIDGVLLKICAETDAVVPVGAAIAYIGNAEEQITPDSIDQTEQPKAVESSAVPSSSPSIEAEPAASALTPASRRFVQEQGLDLAEVEKAFAGKRRVTTAQIEEWLTSRPAQVPVAQASATVASGKTAVSRRPLVGIRKAIAEGMSYSKQVAPHVTICREINAATLVKERNLAALRFAPVRHTITDYAVLAAARALAKHPNVNASLIDGEIISWREVNVGLAVATANGLVVPVIHGASELSFDEISSRAAALSASVRENKAVETDFQNGTFTVSSMGMLGVDMFTPIINQPETAILGVGRIVEKPVVKQGQIVVAPMMFLSLSFDHRVLDGAEAAQFLDTLCKYLEQPELM